MADNRIRILAALDDKVSSGLDKIRDKVNTIGGKGTAASLFGNIGAMAAGAALNLVQNAAAGAVDFLQAASQAAIEEEQSIAKLGTALKANVKDWDGNAEGIEKVLAARMQLGFSDDEQRDSLALVVGATHDYTKALDIQRTAMDLARLKGISLKEASEALVKVEGGSFRILKSLGIQLRDNATQTEALAAVQAVAEGQASSYAKTLGGQVLVNQIKLAEAQERLGASFAPMSVQITEWQVDLVEGIGVVAREWEKSWKSTEQIAFEAMRKVRASTREGIAEAAETVREGSRGSMQRAASELAKQIPNELHEGEQRAHTIVKRTLDDIVGQVRKGRTDWQDAWEQFKEDLDDELTTAAEIAKLKGILVSKRLRHGLKSQDPVLRAQAIATRDIVVKRLQGLEEGAFDWGRKTIVAFIKGMNSKLLALDAAAERAAEKVSDNLRVRSPAKRGPLSKGGGPEAWGKRLTSIYARGMNLSSAMGTSGNIVASRVPYSLQSGSDRMRGRSVENHIHVDLDGREIARAVDRHLYPEWQRAAPTIGKV